MKYYIKSKSGLTIECHSDSERYLALAIENLSLTESYLVPPVSWRRDVNARDCGGLEGQFMRSAERPAGDGAAAVRKPTISLTRHIPLSAQACKPPKSWEVQGLEDRSSA